MIGVMTIIQTYLVNDEDEVATLLELVELRESEQADTDSARLNWIAHGLSECSVSPLARL
jgi:hypothetical protein